MDEIRSSNCDNNAARYQKKKKELMFEQNKRKKKTLPAGTATILYIGKGGSIAKKKK